MFTFVGFLFLRHKRRLRYRSRITDDMLVDSSIFPDSIDESTPLLPNTNIKMPNYTNDPCIIVSVKGLPKTGTHWLEATLRVIKFMTCQSIDAKKSKFCTKSKILSYYKHSLKSFEYYTSQHGQKHATNVKQKFKRLCQIVALRDPRNRILSYFMMDSSAKGILTKNQFNVNTNHTDNTFMYQLQQYVLSKFDETLNDTIAWWNLFTQSRNSDLDDECNDLHTYFVESDKGRSFIYFYEMYVLSSKEILNQLIYFLGIEQYWTQKMVYKLAFKLNWDNVKDQGLPSFQSEFNNYNSNISDYKHQKLNICKYKLFLSNSSVQFCDKKMYQAINKALLLFKLINDTCIIENF